MTSLIKRLFGRNAPERRGSDLQRKAPHRAKAPTTAMSREELRAQSKTLFAAFLEKLSPQMQARVQGFAEAPMQSAALVAADSDAQADLRYLACLVAAGGEAHGAISRNQADLALMLIWAWADDIASIEAVVRLARAFALSWPAASYQALGAALNVAFNTTLKTRDVLQSKSLLDVMPTAALRSRLGAALDQRLPMEIARRFLLSNVEASLAWMDAFSDSPHQDLRHRLITAVKTGDPRLLTGLPMEFFEQVIANRDNLSNYPPDVFYRFLGMVKEILPQIADKHFAEDLDQLGDKLDQLQRRLEALQQRQEALQQRQEALQQRRDALQQRRDAKNERATIRSDMERRDYNAALVRARALWQGNYPEPEDLFCRVDMLNKLGRSKAVQRYAQWLKRAARQQPSAEIALRLWAAGSPQAALDAMGGVDTWQTSELSAQIGLRCLLRLRRFQEADDLARSTIEWPSLERHRRQAYDAMTAITRTGFRISKEQDAALQFLAHWLARNNEMPVPTYVPQTQRVLIYSHSLGIGGAERQVINLISGLCADSEATSVHLLLKEKIQKTYAVSADASRFSTQDFSELDAGLHAPFGDDPLLQEVLANCEILGLGSIEKILTAIYAQRPEVIHVRSGLHAEVGFAAILAGVPRVVVHFGSMTRGAQSAGTELDLMRETFVERAVGLLAAYPQVALVANSRAAADDWARAADIPPSRVKVIYNSVDLGDLRYSARQKQTPEDRPLVVGGVFRFAPVKDPLLWVEVARIVHQAIPDTRFLMVGDGPLRKQVERAIFGANLQSQFDLPGRVTSGMFDYLQQMDLSLITSRTESLPNAVIEAQLAGLPVIAPDVGGVSEAIADHSTAKLTERSAEALAAAVISGLRDTSWRRDVRSRAPDLILKKFSQEQLMKSIKTVYGWSNSANIGVVR